MPPDYKWNEIGIKLVVVRVSACVIRFILFLKNIFVINVKKKYLETFVKDYKVAKIYTSYELFQKHNQLLELSQKYYLCYIKITVTK